MTDNDIVKALECCSVTLMHGEEQNLYKLALDLINRLQAENKRLSILAELGNTRANDYRVMRDRALKAEAENERLKTNLNIELENYATEYDNKIKAEAYKECIEKVEEIICDNTYPDFDINHKAVNIWKAEAYKNIDNLLKELVGEDNG